VAPDGQRRELPVISLKLQRVLGYLIVALAFAVGLSCLALSALAIRHGPKDRRHATRDTRASAHEALAREHTQSQFRYDSAASSATNANAGEEPLLGESANSNPGSGDEFEDRCCGGNSRQCAAAACTARCCGRRALIPPPAARFLLVVFCCCCSSDEEEEEAGLWAYISWFKPW
jgi:hypothetical protein